MPKGNAHLLNASVAKRMRELRLDVAGRLYARSLAPYNKLPHKMELEVHARNALKAAQVLLDVEPTPQPRDTLRPAVREVVARWSLLMEMIVLKGPLDDSAFGKAAHDMSNAMQALVSHVRDSE